MTSLPRIHPFVNNQTFARQSVIHFVIQSELVGNFWKTIDDDG